jgi:Ca2+-binding RTX toxin-like protein
MARINGTPLPDTLIGTPLADQIRGAGGGDTIDALEGNDYVHGEQGNDILYGFLGADEIHGGVGNDTIFGEEDGDNLFGGPDDDTIDAGTGADRVNPGSGTNTVDLGIDSDVDQGFTFAADFLADPGTVTVNNFNGDQDIWHFSGFGALSIDPVTDQIFRGFDNFMVADFNPVAGTDANLIQIGANEWLVV